jgi:hypothetical protein
MIRTPLAHRSGTLGTPFSSAEDAWFWTMGALRARREGTRRGGGSPGRPCDPDDVVRCLERLYRRNRITPAHARVLRFWGGRQVAPDRCPRWESDCALWQEALARLDPMLREKGIVRPEA